MLYDKDFLLKLDKSKDKTIYARITALQFDESPIEYIEGRVTQGSINIDGNSAVRRSCSLSMVAQEYDYHDYYWGLNTKFKLEVGVQNYIDNTMPDIIWFNQGIYLITTFNTSRTTSNFTISISGKDKMCLLNGEIGGSLESSIDFGTIEEEDNNGVWSIRQIPIQDIIRNAVHTYAGEPYWNIIINDLDTYGLELLEYRYDTPMYLYREEKSNIFYNIIMENDNMRVKLSKNGKDIKLSEIPPTHLDTLVDSLTGVETNPQKVYVNGKPYIFAKVEYGQTVGYRITDLVYPGDLIAGIGESLTSVLDKIKNMLTEFEYFYDLDGRFVFQKKKSFTSTMWQVPGEEGENDSAAADNSNIGSSTVYTFNGGELIVSFNNNPNLLNLRNDYSVWGERQSASGATIPVHLRYAIDKKPTKYTQITVEDEQGLAAINAYNAKYGTSLEGRPSSAAITFTSEESDWREVMYQMALDYYKYNILDDFEVRLIKANPQFITGQTGYEKYYIDLQGFWRQLYYPDLDKKIQEIENDIAILNGNSSETSIAYWKNMISIYEEQIIEINKDKEDGVYNSSLDEELILIKINLDKAKKICSSLEYEKENLEADLENNKLKIQDYYYYNEDGSAYQGDRKYWARNVFDCPETLNFWFDFLDTEGELSQFSVKNVGSRSKSINDTTIKSIYFRETPAVVFTNDITTEKQLTGYRYIQIPEEISETMFSISAQGKSAKNKLDELIYQHGYCVESVTITAIPVYYLDVNTRIYLYDEDTGLDGEYVVSKLTLPLAYNGTMSITATRVAESFV